MDRMLLSAVVIWLITLSLFRLGPSVPSAEEALPDRAPAFFTHDSHMENVDDCKACHHRFENGENVLQEDELDGSDAMRCRSCHNTDASLDAKQAFHRQCIQCHRTLEKEGKASAPRTCGQCHPVKMPDDPTPLLIAR